jgi:hypothetical protein
LFGQPTINKIHAIKTTGCESQAIETCNRKKAAITTRSIEKLQIISHNNMTQTQIMTTNKIKQPLNPPQQ